MSTYYRYENLTKRETICLSGQVSIKAGAFSRWNLQLAILHTFLGFDWPNMDIDNPFGEFCGRWKGDSIKLSQDNLDDWADLENADAGVLFLQHLDSIGVLEEWLFHCNLSEVYCPFFVTELRLEKPNLQA